jgi:hypothetical protein
MINKTKIGTIIGAGVLAISIAAGSLVYQTPSQAGPVSIHPGQAQVRDYSDHNYGNGQYRDNGNGNQNWNNRDGNHGRNDRHRADVRAQMDQALSQLRSAQDILSRIPPEDEFHGHRQKSIDYTRQAINELRSAERDDHH